MKKENIKLVAGVLAGTLAGLTIGYLTAPKKGKDTRKMIVDSGKDLAKKVKVKSEKQLEEAKRSYNDSIDRLAESSKHGIDTVKKAISAN